MKRITYGFIILLITFAVLVSCIKPTTAEKQYIDHSNDTTTLSLYGVKLGDSVSVLIQKFENLEYVNLDSISSYLPLDTIHKYAYRDMGISIYEVDTVFFADHDTFQHHDNNGFNKDFPLSKTKHEAKLAYFIKNGRVIQSEILIMYPALGFENIELSSEDFIQSISTIYTNEYNNPDSIMLINRTSNRIAVFSVRTDSIIKQSIYEDLKENENYPRISTIYMWTWKNASIMADWSFYPYKNGKIWHWSPSWMARIIYTDKLAVENEAKRISLEILKEKEDSVKKAEDIQLKYKHSFENQDI